MEEIACCICGSRRHARAWAWIAADEYAPKIPGAPRSSRWVVCRDCGLVFQNPRPDEAGMAALYAEGSYRDWRQVPDHWFTYSRRRPQPSLKWLQSLPEIQRLGQEPPERRAVLDIGCGVGGALRAFADRGWRAYGVEPTALLARAGTERFGIPIAPEFMHPGLFPGVEFSLVYSLHSFEHLLDPLAVARSARRILERTRGRGRYMFVAVPTFAHADHLAWEWMNTAHTYLFTAASLGNLLARAAFRVLHVKYPRYTFHDRWEPSELWMLAEVDPDMDGRPLPYRQSLAGVQATLLTVPFVAVWNSDFGIRQVRRQARRWARKLDRWRARTA